MLLSFPGKGCEHCPFYRRSEKEYRYHPEWQYCWLHGRTFLEEPQIKINEGKKPLLWRDPHRLAVWLHYGTVQITALEGTC